MATTLPANIANMVTGLAQSVQAVGAGTGGQMFMKMSKAGEFLYGAEEIEVEEGSTWAANPAGFMHGWIAWGDKAHGTAGKMLGEKLGPAAQAIFPEADLGPVEGTWTQAIAIQLRCMDGEDEGLQALYKANSHGGRKAYAALLGEVVKKITAGDADFVPLVRLANTSYKHDEYGKIFNPDFIITGWATMDEQPEVPAEEEEEAEEVPEEKPKRKRKARAKAPVEDEEEAEDAELVGEEEAEEPAPKRRRRRKAA